MHVHLQKFNFNYLLTPCGLNLTTLGIQSYSQMMIGVSNHLLTIVFRFHYHFQEVIGSLGLVNLECKNTKKASPKALTLGAPPIWSPSWEVTRSLACQRLLDDDIDLGPSGWFGAKKLLVVFIGSPKDWVGPPHCPTNYFQIPFMALSVGWYMGVIWSPQVTSTPEGLQGRFLAVDLAGNSNRWPREKSSKI